MSLDLRNQTTSNSLSLSLSLPWIRERASMELASFVGRALFVSVFLLSAWQEFNGFGDDGGRAAKSLRPKFNAFVSHVTTHTGQQLPPVDMKILVAAAIALKGIGGLLFVFGSSLGAYLLLCGFSFCIKPLPPRFCMISTTTMLTKRNSANCFPSLLRAWHSLGHYSSSLE
ncbi:uncharacterized protein LOC106411708 isoform X2 [Brassica napus]|uniref:uncharacterized protein LOC106411708 isoform X2 n=1 Tax=Brassica napus TaxID=3708 RepID=UPI000BBF2266|nr:uncharacterized protein LOC106411708 isoform X2 [Brassica napus]